MTVFVLGVLVASLLGGHSTYWLSHRTRLGAVRASTVATLVFVAATYPLNPFWLLIPKLQAAFFGGTFVGMSDSSRLGEKRIFLASAVFGIIFCILSQFRGGIGGTLGASAFLACILVFLIPRKSKLFRWLYR